MHPAPKGRVLAGIIPITGRENVLGLPWEDCLQPLSYQCTALERSVYECAVMNCDSIWIICNDDTAPLIKKRIGDYVLNPNIYDDWHFKKIPGGSKEYIPVFYRYRFRSCTYPSLFGQYSPMNLTDSLT